jgi:polar amino acid transport system substrate-binding protein
LLLAAVTLGSSCSSSPPTTGDSLARAQLAPTGTMRIGLNLGNTLLVQKSAKSGEPEGVAVQVARELGARLGVPITFVTFPSPAVLADAAKDKAWDVAFLADDPARQAMIAFSPAYVTIEATYLVLADSTYRNANEVDSPGSRIAVSKGSAYDLYLSRSLRAAKLLQVDSTPAALGKIRAGEADAVAGLRAMLADTAATEPAYRVVDGAFTSAQQSIGTLRGNEAATAYVAAFVNDVKRSGRIASILAEHRARGLAVAP